VLSARLERRSSAAVSRREQRTDAATPARTSA
jgi:hypothetical protein